MSQPSTIAAFNLMGRCAKTESELIIKANLYSEFRNQIAINNSLRNKGRKLTASQLEKMSTHMKNKVIVHYPDSDTNFQIDRDDLRYLNGDVILCQVGRIHTDKTKQKMSDNGIKDCIQIYNISKPDKTRFIPNTEDIPQGFDIGNPSHSSIAVERFTGAHHFYNPTTKESKRFKVTENIPDGFIQTRDGYDNPWKGVVIYKNWVTNQTETHPKLDELPFGVSENTCKHAFIFEGKITFSLQRLLRVHPDKFNNSVIQKLIRLDAPKKIFSYKVSPCIRNYIQTFEFYNDIPLVILPIYEVVDKITPENWL
jgi:hypothetical protein